MSDRRPLPHAAELIWTSQQLHPGSPLGNMAFLVRIEGDIDPDRFVQAVADVANMSSTLASVVEVDARGRPFLVDGAVPETSRLAVSDEALDAWAEERIAHPLPASGPTWESVLVDRTDGRWAWWFSANHVLLDARGMANVWAAVAASYSGAPTGSRQRREHPTSPADERAAIHWRSWSATAGRGLYRRPERSDTRAERLEVDLTDRRTRIAELLDDERFALFGDDLSALAVAATMTASWIHLVTGRRDIVLGVPVHHRSGADADAIDLLMELYPTLVQIDPAEDLVTLHDRVRTALLSTLRRARRGTSPRQDVDAIVNTFTVGFSDIGGVPVRARWVPNGHVDPHHPVRVQFTDVGGGRELHVDVNVAFADDIHRRRIPEHIGVVLDHLLHRPGAIVGSIDLRTDDERIALRRWHDNAHSAPSETIIASVAHRLATTSEPVLIDGDRSFDGPSADQAITATVDALIEQGVRPGDRVAVRMRRSAEVVIAVHAVWRAGCSVVPVDPDHPPARQEHVIADSGAVLTLDRLPAAIVVGARADPSHRSATAPGTLDDEAYVIYTSGSTGLPKGVPITHRGLAEYAAIAVAEYGPGPTSMPLFTSIGFDLTITTLVVPWLTGGAVIALDGDPLGMLSAIADDDRIDAVKCTPSHLDLLVRLTSRSAPYRTLIVGGEAFGRDLAERARLSLGDHVKIVNEYGPTEAVVGCMEHVHSPHDPGPDVPIGRPMPGVELRIERDGTEVAIGAPGELLIRRPGLTTGYLGRDELNVERFVTRGAGPPWYRSGDLVRFVDDRTLVYLGRLDEQLKVGGVRVEPGEIEAALRSHPDVDRAVVRLWRPDPDAPVERCMRCGVPGNVPNVSFDDEGVCRDCRHFERVAPQAERYWRDEEALRAEIDGARRRRTGDFDLLHLLSGGKDSTYALYRLAELGARIHCLTLDNGFISDGALANVAATAADLGVSHEIVTVDGMNEIFRESLERFSNVCNGCYKAIYTLGLTRADQLGIPVVVTGLSRGQLFETRLTPEQFEADRFDPDRIDDAVLAARKAYHRNRDAVSRLLPTDLFDTDDVFERITFLDFYRYVDVPLDEMLAYLDRRAPWVRPPDTGRSTNCLINDAGITVHLRERGYHNYAVPYSWDVRLGHKTRDEAIDELRDELDQQRVSTMLHTVGYDPRPPELLTAWIVPRGEREVDAAELRAHLSDLLPTAAIPSAFTRLRELPLTPNGKVDPSRLPPPTRRRSDASPLVAPADDVELALMELWTDLLGIETVAVTDDFFDLGGTSLLALQLVIRIEQAFAIDLPEREAFSRRTVADMAQLVRAHLPHTAAGAEAPGIAPIPRIQSGDEEPAPLTEGQRVLIDQVGEEQPARYLVTQHLVVDGGVDVDEIGRRLHAAAARHEALHTTLRGPRRILPPDEAVEIRRFDDERPSAEVDALIEETARTPLDLARGPLVRLTTARDEVGDHHLALTVHHASGDEASLELLWDELTAAQPVSAAPSVRYRDVAAWIDDEADRLLESVVERLATWRPSPLPSARPARPGSDGYLRRATGLRADSCPTRPTVLAATSLAILLAALGREATVGVGLVTSLRSHADSARTIGYLLNTVPLGLDVDPEARISSLFESVDATMGEAVAGAAVPLGRALGAGGAGAAPRILLVIASERDRLIDGQRARGSIVHNGTAVADATFFLHATEAGLELAIEYSGAVTDQSSAQALLDAWAQLLVTVATASPDTTIGALPLRPDPGPWPGAELVAAQPIVQMLDARLAADPEGVVVSCGPSTFDARTFDERARRISTALREVGVAPGDRVGLVAGRSADQLVAVWAILRCGASYVPIDPAHPAERIHRCLRAAGVRAVLHDGRDLPGEIPALALDEAVASPADPSPPVEDGPEAYVIFTSGSTGEPKGVPVTHANLAASLAARRMHYAEPVERFLLVSSLGFDSSVAGLFWTLCTTGALVVPTDSEVHDVDALVGLIREHRVTHMLMVPSLYAALLTRGAGQLGALRQVVVAGEACPTALVDQHLRESAARLDNEYGPTEGTVWATVAHLTTSTDPVPIGAPVAGVTAAVIDAGGRAVPDGLPGELAIAGPTVVAGYLDGPGDRFGAVPTLGPHAYRTGDRVRRVGETLHFLGRLDEQLSVGGARIEPGEVEAALSAHEQIDAAAVVLRHDLPPDWLARLAASGEIDVADLLRAAADSREPLAELQRRTAEALGLRPQLVAYLTGQPTATGPILAGLRRSLPGPAVPTRLEWINELPTTAHGKVDRHALRGRATQLVAPVPSVAADPATAAMVDLWRHVFGRSDIGPDDDFFELGGDSLRAVALLTELARRHGRDLVVADLLERRTPRALAASAASTETPAQSLRSTLRTGGDRPSLILLPPSGGNLLGYEPFVNHLRSSRPVVGLRAVGADGLEPPTTTVAAAVDRWFTEVVGTATGPVHLLGWSTGGIMAYELGARLEAAGIDVRSVIMLDTTHPAHRATVIRQERGGRYLDILRSRDLRRAGLEARGILDKRRTRLRRRAQWTWRRRSGRPLDPLLVERWLMDTANAAVAAYEPGPPPPGLALVLAEASDPQLVADPWRRHVPDLDVLLVSGAHAGPDSIMEPHRAPTTAAAVDDLLDRRDAGGVVTTATAAILTRARTIELSELPIPAVTADDAILRVEACGICGTDVEQYADHGSVPRPFPLIPGHEPVGVVEAIGDEAARRWGIDVGDRVAVEPFVPCGSCGYCLTGRYEHCGGWGRVMAYGFLPLDLAPGLWGGYATHLYLHPGAVVHRVPPGIDPELAVLFNPLGAGVRWAVTLPRTAIGDTVVVLGPGQRGLASVIAARAAGAGTVIVTGLGRDRHKLDLALRFGADHTIDVEAEPAIDRVRQLTGGRMADVVVDVTAGAPGVVTDAVAMARAGGTVVLGGLKGDPVPAFPSDDVVLRGITIIGARGVDYPAYREALAIIASARLPLDELRSHVFGLADAATAVEVLAGERAGEHPVNVVIAPPR